MILRRPKGLTAALLLTVAFAAASCSSSGFVAVLEDPLTGARFEARFIYSGDTLTRVENTMVFSDEATAEYQRSLLPEGTQSSLEGSTLTYTSKNISVYSAMSREELKRMFTESGYRVK